MFEVQMGNVNEVIDDGGAVIDSNMSFDEAVKGSDAPKDVIDQMVLVDVKYYGLDGKIHHGQIMVNKSIENDIKLIFYKFLQHKFAIGKCVPMSFYDWDDDKAMSDNNTSGFCYKKVRNTVSKNSMGLALDVNPILNPLMMDDGTIIPKGGTYNVEKPGTFVMGSDVIKFIENLGFRWGRDLDDADDMYHFEKKTSYCGK